MAKLLNNYEDYSRQEAQEIFEPEYNFIPQTGTWGRRGIIKIKERTGDFVFFVTFGQQEAGHEFIENITEDGVLTWQSQPGQKLEHNMIREFINHNEITNSIYLFLRTDKSREKWTYLGKLEYLEHDNMREKPVYFRWQILEWNITEETLDRIGLELEKNPRNFNPNKDSLIERKIEASDTQKEKNTKRSFRARKNADFSGREKRNKKLGLDGELLVLNKEKNRLIEMERKDLAEKIIHVSVVEGDGAGYDILSFDEDGTKRFIEVKTTTGSESNDFFISPNEIEFSKKHKDKYCLYRVYLYDEKNNSGYFDVLKGSIEEHVTLIPTSYRAKLR